MNRPRIFGGKCRCDSACDRDRVDHSADFLVAAYHTPGNGGPAPDPSASVVAAVLHRIVLGCWPNLGNCLGGLLGRLFHWQGGTTVLPASGAELVLSVLTLCVLPAVGEELLFRGALQGLMRPCGSAAAVFGPALLFALLHMNLSQGITAFLCGIFLGWLTERTGSVLPGMMLHLINNCIAFADIYLQMYAPNNIAMGIELFVLLFFPLAAGMAPLASGHPAGLFLWCRDASGRRCAVCFYKPRLHVGNFVPGSCKRLFLNHCRIRGIYDRFGIDAGSSGRSEDRGRFGRSPGRCRDRQGWEIVARGPQSAGKREKCHLPCRAACH